MGLRAALSDGSLLRIREFDSATDLQEVQELERRCEAGPNGSISLFADLLGDPLCRVRHFPVFTMLVAEAKLQIVGMIRAGVKDVVCGKTVYVRKRSSVSKMEFREEAPIYGRVGYVLGLRVSPSHRRMGIGQKLAEAIESWCKDQGAEYAYMATENDNDASVKLFIGKLGYKILRTPTILVHPVFQHARGIPSHIRLTKLSVNDSAILYRSVMLTRDFFPKDIDKVLASRLYAGTWIATLKADEPSGLRKLRGGEGISIRSAYDGNAQRLMDGVFKSWAVLSIWKCDEIFKLQVKGASLIVRSLAAMSRYMDRTLPWFEIPSFPNIFNSFGMQFLFGLHAEGDKSHELITALFWHAHNLAQQQKSQVIMSELGPSDPLIKTIPHWKVFSSADDLWCIKHLLDPPIKDAASLSTVSATANSTSETVVDRVEHIEWSDSSPDSTIFVDPRDV